MSLHVSSTPNRTTLHKDQSFHQLGTPNDFRRLYPDQPSIPRYIKDNIEIVLIHRKNRLRATVYLERILHQVVYKFEEQTNCREALKETARVIGFQSTDGDTLLDYRVTIGNGILDRTTDFRCLYYTGDTKGSSLQHYKIIKCLAIGGFSKVYLVRSLYDGKFYALKAMSKQFLKENKKQSVVSNQKNICSQLSHPFIVDMKHCFESKNFLCFVFEYCPGGELFYYLKSVKRIPEAKSKFYFTQILYGLQYLHQKGIIYRDLKPQNLLINVDGHIKIVDFGLSKDNMEPGNLTYSYCGSTEYMPPEMILKTGHSFGVDFYTLGALLYQIVTGLPPFYSHDESQIRQNALNKQLTFPEDLELSQDLRGLLRGLLNKNQKLRLGSLKGIKEILFHPWLGKMNSEQILSKSLTPPYVPDINEFNFDDGELGDDQEDFTRKLKVDSQKTVNFCDLMFQKFEHQKDLDLKSGHSAIIRTLSPPKPVSFNSKILPKSNSLQALRFSHSIKALCSNSIITRDHRSPYFGSFYKKQRNLQPQNQNSNQHSNSGTHLRPKRKVLQKVVSPTAYQSSSIKRRKLKRLI